MDSERLREYLTTARRRRELPSPAFRREIRVRARVRQAEVARILGVNRSTVCRWESGDRTPDGDLLDAYTELLDRMLDEVAS